MSDIRRHDLTLETWVRVWPLILQAKGKRGRKGKDNYLFFNAVLWRLRTGIPWRDLPPCYGAWKSVSNRFYTWRNTGVWARLLELVAGEPDLEWIMIDASHIKAHPHAAGAKGGPRRSRAPKAGRTRSCIWPSRPMACRCA